MPKEVTAISPGATWNDITGPSRPRAASSPGPHRFRGLPELNIQIISALQMSPKPLIMTSWCTEGAERNGKWQTYPLSAFCSFQVFLIEARHFFSAYFSTVLLAITKDYMYIYICTYTCYYTMKGERTDLNASEIEKAVLLSSWGVKACSVFTCCQRSAWTMDLLGGRDREQNEIGRTTSPVKFTERLCAWYSASIIYLLLDVVKSWQRQVVTQEVQTKIESLQKSKQNNSSPFQV